MLIEHRVGAIGKEKSPTLRRVQKRPLMLNKLSRQWPRMPWLREQKRSCIASFQTRLNFKTIQKRKTVAVAVTFCSSRIKVYFSVPCIRVINMKELEKVNVS